MEKAQSAIEANFTPKDRMQGQQKTRMSAEQENMLLRALGLRDEEIGWIRRMAEREAQDPVSFTCQSVRLHMAGIAENTYMLGYETSKQLAAVFKSPD